LVVPIDNLSFNTEPLLSSRLSFDFQAGRIIEASWRLNPHPEFAEIFAHPRIADSARERLDGRRALLRTAPGPTIDPVCRALCITLPPVFQEIPPAPNPA